MLRARSCIAHVVLVGVLTVLAAAPAAPAHVRSHGGGSMAAEGPEVEGLKCDTGDKRACPQGKMLRLSGENLSDTRKVVFLGGRGSGDNERVLPRKASEHRLLVTVPEDARTGRLRVVAEEDRTKTPRLKVLPPDEEPAQSAPASPKSTSGDGGIFPVRGKHDYGTHTNHFGGGRNHKGHDVFAACGTKLVAALPGKVTLTKWHDAAGHYVVVKADDGTSQAYMHLSKPASVSKGQRVEAGTPIGQVGDTGRATGCHLHFELWTAPGWYEGGEAIDPLPYLKRWDKAS